MKFKNSVDNAFDSNTKELNIRKFLINDLRFSYKRGSSRLITSKKKNSVHLWSIFSSRMLFALYEKRLIVNIDESSYNRSVKSNYSWLPIGCSSPILNTNCTGRTTIILGLFSNGHWLWMSVNGTTQAGHFWVFLQLLHKFIENCWEQQADTTKVVFDNARIHLTDKVKRLWTYLRL